MSRRPLLLALPLLFAASLAYADHTLYRALVRTTAGPPQVGAATDVRVSILAPGGFQVRQFDPLHGVTMHLIAVSQDLEDFAHVHPRASVTGTLSTTLTFSKAQPYTLVMEYDPAGSARERTTRSTVRPAGAQPKPATLSAIGAFDGTSNRTRSISATAFAVIGHPGATLRAGAPVKLHLRISDPNGAKLGLQDYLGMRGHAIVFSQDLATFQHLHGEPLTGGMTGGVHGGHGGSGGDPNATSEDLIYETTFPSAGLHKVFFQINRGGRILTAPFVVKVAPGS